MEEQYLTINTASKQYECRNNEIIGFFNNIYSLSSEAIEFLSENTTFLELKKGKYLRSPLDREEMLYFIITGVVRGFIKEDGVEITTWISEENTLIGSIRNLGLEISTEEYIQALEDIKLIAISRKSIDVLYDRFYEANIIGRKILEVYYRDAEERAFLCRLPSAEKRYQRFVQTRSDLLGRVSLKYIASFLGMKLETLSRIRSKTL